MHAFYTLNVYIKHSDCVPMECEDRATLTWLFEQPFGKL